jgi:IS30 family transposase
MKTYHHISEVERNEIVAQLNRGASLRDIGKLLGRHPSTLSRELERNRGKTRYRANCAQERAVKNHRDAHKRPRLKSNALRHEVEQMLYKKWSPELIAGRLRKRSDLPPISPEAIYQWIYSEAPHLIGCLTRTHKQRWPKGKRKRSRIHHIVGKTSIAQRPEAANKRTTIGHWETDLVIGKGRSALKVVVERKSRLTKLKIVKDTTARISNNALIGMLLPLPETVRQSITYDNGSENTKHAELNTILRTKSFFCEPYHSWEKGTVENTNGIIRRFFPKKTNFDTLSDNEIRKVESWLNSRPRKCLDFLTPQESFDSGVALTG